MARQPETITKAPSARELVEPLLHAKSDYLFAFSQIAEKPEAVQLLAADARTQIDALRLCADRIGAVREIFGDPANNISYYMNPRFQEHFPVVASMLIDRLLRRKLPLTDDD